MSLATEMLQRPHGRLLLLTPERPQFPEKPLVLLLHGAFEKHKKLLPWAEVWRDSFDVALADLPGAWAERSTPACDLRQLCR